MRTVTCPSSPIRIPPSPLFQRANHIGVASRRQIPASSTPMRATLSHVPEHGSVPLSWRVEAVRPPNRDAIVGMALSLDLKQRVALSSIAASAGLALAKAAVGLATGSLAILSEAGHSLLDLAATV